MMMGGRNLVREDPNIVLRARGTSARARSAAACMMLFCAGDVCLLGQSPDAVPRSIVDGHYEAAEDAARRLVSRLEQEAALPSTSRAPPMC